MCDFLRHERKYILLFIVTLIAVFSLPAEYTPAKLVSPAVTRLQQSAKAAEASLLEPGGWAVLAHARPATFIVWVSCLALFTVLFFGGWVYALCLAFIPRLRRWFESRDAPAPSQWQAILFFRALILCVAFVVLAGIIISGWQPDWKSDNALAILHTLLIDALACLAVFAALSETGGHPGFFFQKPPAGYAAEVKRGLAAYLATFPFFITAMLLILGITAHMHYEPPAHPLVKIFVEEQMRSPFVFYLALTLAAIGAPVMEEIFFRGFCYAIFRSIWAPLLAAVISAFFFAGSHGFGIAFVPIFILGFALARLHEKRRSLIACWTFHIAHNILFTGYFFAAKAVIN